MGMVVVVAPMVGAMEVMVAAVVALVVDPAEVAVEEEEDGVEEVSNSITSYYLSSQHLLRYCIASNMGFLLLLPKLFTNVIYLCSLEIMSITNSEALVSYLVHETHISKVKHHLRLH